MSVGIDGTDGGSLESEELLALLLEEEGWGAAETPAIPRRIEAEGDAPLSFAQQRLCSVDRLEPGKATYNIPLGLRLRGPLDVAALESALARVVERHEALRSRFLLVRGTPVQRVEPAAGIALGKLDLS